MDDEPREVYQIHHEIAQRCFTEIIALMKRLGHEDPKEVHAIVRCGLLIHAEYIDMKYGITMGDPEEVLKRRRDDQSRD